MRDYRQTKMERKRGRVRETEERKTKKNKKTKRENMPLTDYINK